MDASTRHALRFGCAFLLALGTGRAALDFDTYSILKHTVQVTHDGKASDSSWTTFELTRLGSVSLEASSISLTSHGSYLSVLEEATLTGNVENRPHNITEDFLFQGSLPIPHGAAVHALSAEHGDTLYRAQLHKTTYSLDDAFFDTTALRTTLDTRVAFLQQLTDNGFEATLSKLTLGEPVRVRIEYDLPIPGGPDAAITIPVLFDPSGAQPRQIQIDFNELDTNLPALQWLSPQGRVTLNDKGTLTTAYQSSFQFRRDENPGTVVSLQTSAFESGAFKGDYMLFKGGLNDSLMQLLTRKLEVVFLWRWNPPYNFVEMQNGLKTLSALGLQAAAEARTLKQIIQEMAPRGHRFGLLRSAPDKADTLFAPADTGSDGYKKMLAYLDGFSEDRLYQDYKDYKDTQAVWAATAWQDSGAVIKSKEAFLATLRTVRAGFGKDPDVMRHIEIIGLGSAPSTLLDMKDAQPVEAILDSVTIANVLGYWLGMDLNSALNVKADADLRPLTISSPLAAGLPPLLFPVFQPTSVEYRAFTLARSQSVVLPFAQDSQREAVFKALDPFADSMELQGIDALGKKTRIFVLSPRVEKAPDDSGLARIWAADPDRISEASEVDLGMRYGILTKGTYWGAGVSDALTVTPQNPGQTSALLPKSIRVRADAGFRVVDGFLRIEIASPALAGPAPRLEIYDLRGRLIASISLEGYRSGYGYAIPIDFLRRLGDRVVLAFRAKGSLQSYTLNLGGFR